jgi:hypothetical protein
MGGACSTYGDRSGVYRVLVGKPEGETDHLGDRGVDGRTILKRIFGMWDGGLDWIDVVQDRDT